MKNRPYMEERRKPRGRAVIFKVGMAYFRKKQQET